MKAGYKVTNSIVLQNFSDYILVCNYHGLNEIFNCCLSSRYGIGGTKSSIGIWKIKSKK